MSRLLVSTVLFLFALLILIVARWKEISWLWKSWWGKVVLIALVFIYALFNVFDFAGKAGSSQPGVQAILDSLNIKNKETINLIEDLSAKVDEYNDTVVARYNRYGPGLHADSARFDISKPLALSSIPKLVYMSENDVAVVIKLSNNSSSPAFIGNFRSYLVEIDSLTSTGQSPIQADAVKQTGDKSAIRIGRLRELPSYIDDYHIIIFVHSSAGVHKIKKFTVLYITASNGSTYCESQSLPLNWTSDGMAERSIFENAICEYLDEHVGAINN